MFDSPGTTAAAATDVVLGIDPGVSICGYGALRREPPGFRAVACGVVRTPPADPLPERLAALWHELDALVETLAPRAIAVERVLFQVNTRTAMSVGQASGLALAIAGRRGIPVVQYSPNEVKLAVAGDGGAGKDEVQRMVARLCGLAETPSPPDAADALALALCHWWQAPLRAAAARAGIAATADQPDRLGAAIAAAVAKESRS